MRVKSMSAKNTKNKKEKIFVLLNNAMALNISMANAIKPIFRDWRPV